MIAMLPTIVNLFFRHLKFFLNRINTTATNTA
jgi:hypothetical protein